MKLRHATFVSALVLASLWLGAGSASAGGGCYHGIPPSDGTGDRVQMTGNCFEATVLHIDPGTVVTWVNEDPYAHTVTGVGGTWGDFTELAQGDTASYRFGGNGVYVYSCLIHPGMVGAVVVGDGSGDAGLDPAAVVPLPAADSPAGTAAAETSAVSGNAPAAWAAAIAGVLGISLGLALARARSRTGRGIARARA
jgi:plastocyanin